MTVTRRAGMLAASMLLLAGCTFGGGDDDETTTTDDGQTTVEETSEQPADPPTATAELTDVHELIQLDTGVQIAVGSAEVDADLVRIPIEAWNGDIDEVVFGGTEPFLTDNVGTSYLFVPPDTNAELRATSGEVMRGVLVFELDAEELPENPGRFNLQLNRFSSGEPQAEFRDIPYGLVG